MYDLGLSLGEHMKWLFVGTGSILGNSQDYDGRPQLIPGDLDDGTYPAGVRSASARAPRARFARPSP